MVKAADWSTELFGPKLLTKPQTSGIPTASVFDGKKLVVLYFSASWCPPCRTFSPKLIEFYDSCKDDLSVIFVSSDRDEKSFNGYFGKMPWHAMVPSYASKSDRARHGGLSSMFKIKSIPKVIVLDAKTGLFITDNARTEVIEAASDASKKALVQSWLSKEAVPIDQAVLGGGDGSGGSDNLPVKVFKYFLSKPTHLFGLLFLIKRLVLYFQEMGKDGIEAQKEL